MSQGLTPLTSQPRPFHRTFHATGSLNRPFFACLRAPQKYKNGSVRFSFGHNLAEILYTFIQKSRFWRVIYTLKPVYAQEPERGFFLWRFPAVATSRVFSRILPPQVARNGRNRRIIDSRVKRDRRKLSVILATNASTFDLTWLTILRRKFPCRRVGCVGS